MNKQATDVDGYLSSVPDDARTTLEGLRRTIREVAPGAVESISYGMPAFKYQGRRLAYFAAAKNHCALYGLSTERAQLAGLDTSQKGTIRFPHDAPPPEALVKELLSMRIAAIEAELETKRKKAAKEASG